MDERALRDGGARSHTPLPPGKKNSTVADGTCSFPSNMFGCESAAKGITGGGVRFLKEDRELECEGRDAGKCASRPTFQ